MHKKSGHIHIEAEINTKRNKTKKKMRKDTQILMKKV